MTDPIADMLTRIRNGFRVGKAEIMVPASRLKQALGELLVREGYLVKVEKITVDKLPQSPRTSRRAASRGRTDVLRLVLKYKGDGQPVAEGLERVSKPSRRVYVSHQELPVVRSGLGIAILSTSQGLMTSRQAHHAGVGGEVICHIY